MRQPVDAILQLTDTGQGPPDEADQHDKRQPVPFRNVTKPTTMSNPNTSEQVARLIEQECDSIKALLLAKNRAYGNSALDPVRIFSKADPVEQIRVLIDDKLSRLSRGSAAGEDVEQDLLGYLVLLRVARKLSPHNADRGWVGSCKTAVEDHDLDSIRRSVERPGGHTELSDSSTPPSAVSLNPGEGYRLLGPDETVQEGDDFFGLGSNQWIPVDSTPGSRVSDAMGKFSCVAAYRRELAACPGAGERLGAPVE